MDSVQHAYAPALAVYAATGHVDEALIAGGIAIIPDAVEWAEKAFRKDNTPWLWYEMLHSNAAIIVALAMGTATLIITLINGEGHYLCLYFYGYALHPILDKFTHGEGKRWYVFNERYWAESLAWVLLTVAAGFVSQVFLAIGGIVLMVATSIIGNSYTRRA